MLYKIVSLMVIACSVIAFAKEQIISPIPLPSQEIADLDIKKCSKSCLNKLFEEGQYFSFLSLYRDNNDKALREKFQVASGILDSAILHPVSIAQSGIRIALLIPQKNIGRYSVSSADSILAYLIAKGGDFEFNVFDSQNEESTNLSQTYHVIQKQNFDYVIAILTSKGLENLLQNTEITLPIFIPTLNQTQISPSLNTQNLFFGGIDYHKQIDMMLTLAHSKKAKIISYNDNGVIGKMLGNIIEKKSQDTLVSEIVDSKKATKFNESINKIRKNLKESMIILNTSVIKSGLIIPQIGNTKTMPMAFLSSQINYNPSLLKLVPKEDSTKIFVVNAISPVNIKLLAFSDLLSSDLQYDWVNYATALAVDIMLANSTKGGIRFFGEKLQGNQVLYNDRFYGVKDAHFVPVKLR
ncbi:hypothetical protein [Helicobacter sp. MIT 14-3879]|uniref:hypothetical protein n=1 Tax=Helicobacter sp. MIT 14-3879 TaxID=2040649 RepID=UPI000E1F2A6F|nr:hypothetical protein [Helicobacter sp. MIT 14-3879]RDU59481.1 hypothetical protein CQA44_11405 [Helicobacter sp. MIT 14-3879]